MSTSRPKFTLLYVTDEPSRETLERLLQLADGDSVVISNPVQAVALLFVNRRIDAVVLDQTTRGRGAGLAQALRSVRPDVPIVVLGSDPADALPSGADACVNIDRDVESLRPVLDTLLTERGAVRLHAH